LPLRRADANVSVPKIIEHVAQYHAFEVRATMVKRVLREEELARPRGPVPGAGHGPEQRLELGGMKLVEAALVETGYVEAPSVAVTEQLAEVPTPESPVSIDQRAAKSPETWWAEPGKLATCNTGTQELEQGTAAFTAWFR
jgi:hypothetical protein